MSKKIKKSDMELLGEQEIYRLIKQHPEINACSKKLTLEQIRAVFRAYRDIVYTGAKMNKRIILPNVGQFYSQETKGWQGGYMSFRKDFNDDNSWTREYFEPKPDCYSLKFELNKSLKDKFKKDTEIPVPQMVKDILKKEADAKEKERLEKESYE